MMMLDEGSCLVTHNEVYHDDDRFILTTLICDREMVLYSFSSVVSQYANLVMKRRP